MRGLHGADAHARERKQSEINTRFQQGVAMLQLKQYEHAITAFHRVLALDPLLPEAHVNMGFAFYGQGDFVGAERFFRGALSLSPKQYNAHYGIAIARQALGDLTEARDELVAYVSSLKDGDPYVDAAKQRLQEIEIALRSKTTPQPSLGKNSGEPDRALQ